MSILDTNLAVILDIATARRLGLTDEQMFAQVAREIRHIPGVRQVYEYQLNSSEVAVEDLRHDTKRMQKLSSENLEDDYEGEHRFRGDICT